MRKNEIICAFYNPLAKRSEKYHSFMKVVIEHKEKICPLYFEEDHGTYLIVFYRRKLKKLMKFLKDEALDFYEKIMTGKYRHCAQCGCGYLTYSSFTYRCTDGCLGKSFECEVCRLISDDDIQMVKKCADRYGTKDTLLKILYDELFVDSDLPF